MDNKTTPSDSVQALINPRQVVDPQTLNAWVTNDLLDAQTANLFTQLLKARRTRECWWPNKMQDGTNPGQPYGSALAYPYEGAIDHEVRVVDGQINEEVDLALLAFFRSEKIVRPRDAMNDEQTQRATAWRHATEYFLDVTKRSLLSNIELFANSLSETGKAVWYEGWKDRWRMGRKTMKWQDVIDAAVSSVEEPMEQQNGGQELPPEVQQQITQQISMQLEMMRQDASQINQFKEQIAAVDPAIVDPAELNKLAKAFAKGEDSFDYFCPIKAGAVPIHRAYLLGVDCFCPSMSRATEDAEDSIPRMALVEWYSEARLRTESQQDDWDKEFTEEVLEKGAGLAFDLAAIGGGASSWELNGYDMGMTYNTSSLRNAGLYQIVTLWYWGVSKAGLPAPYRAILSPSACPTKCAKQECDPFGHGQMPWFLKTRNIKRATAMGAQGVADEMLTNQLGRKKLEDGMISQTELRSNPPMKETTDRGGVIRPGARLTVSNRHIAKDVDVFLEVPDLSEGSLKMLDWLKREKDDYYCTGPGADPDAKRTRRFTKLFKWCAIYEDIIKLMCLNIQKGVDEIKLGSIGGVAVDWTIRGEDLQGELDVVVRCDEGTVDFELAMKKLDAIIKIMPLNQDGTIVMSDIVRRALTWIDPDMVRTGVSNPQEAKERITKDENARIIGMCNGVKPEWEKQADAPQARLDAYTKWTQTPGNDERIMQSRILQKYLDLEKVWIDFAISQQVTNPNTGRTGIDSDKVNQQLQTAQR